MVLEEIHIPVLPSLSKCGAGGAFFVGSCTEVFQASTMKSEWVSGDLLGDGTFSAESRVPAPKETQRNTMSSPSSRLLKNNFHEKAEILLLERLCHLLTSVFQFQPTHVTGRML